MLFLSEFFKRVLYIRYKFLNITPKKLKTEHPVNKNEELNMDVSKTKKTNSRIKFENIKQL